MPTMTLKNSEPFSFYLEKEHAEELREYRWKNRITSMSEAIRILVLKGLEATKQEQTDKLSE